MMLIILRGDFVPHRAFKLFRCQESSPHLSRRWTLDLTALDEKFPVRRSREFFSQGAVSSSKIVVMQLLAYAYFREVTVFFAVIGNSNDRDGFAGDYGAHHALLCTRRFPDHEQKARYWWEFDWCVCLCR